MGRLAQLAVQYNLTAYDASYLELALRLNLPLASKNGPLSDAAREAGLLLDLR
jgi:predicted nucleic acid-binding protein